MTERVEERHRRGFPTWFRRSGPLTLVWKAIRKWLNVSVIPFIPFNTLRIHGYRLVGFRIGRDVFIGMQCYLDDMYPQRLVIEDHVVISYRVTVACHGPRSCDHRLILREGSYIGTGATLLGGLPGGDTEIGPYATVGACSLVTRSVPPLATVVGMPARVTRTIRQPWGSDDDKAVMLRGRYLADTAPQPRFQPNGGEFAAAILVTLETTQDRDTLIRYTLDGSEPTEDTALYQEPLALDNTTTLRARGFQAGRFPSAEVSRTFTRVD